MGLIAWIAPAVLFAGSAAWLVIWLRRGSRSKTTIDAPAVDPPSKDMLDRLDDELAQI